MANPLIPRATVHAWSDQIGEAAHEHTTALQRLLKDQRRLTRFIEKNAEQLGGASPGVCVYLTGVIARMFDLAGGRLKGATWSDVHAAEAKVQGALDGLLPLDDGFLDRLHALDGRAQAHIVDEAAMVLFEQEPSEEEEELDKVEALKVLLICWVVTEVLDGLWSPPKAFVGESSYTYVHLEPTRPKAEGTTEG
ncbi:MAG: hypothetical protein H6732_17260 [Alphaproteobacteria bacterium]|nr:hypothetical protein [Alphaproteobacteria bacterium]